MDASTNVLGLLSPGDEIRFVLRGGEYSYGVQGVATENQITLTEKSEVTANGLNCFNLPNRPYRGKNRKWMIAGHKLREPMTAISSVQDALYFTVSDISDFEPGDAIQVKGADARIVRIVEQGMVIEQQLSFTPRVGMKVRKKPDLCRLV